MKYSILLLLSLFFFVNCDDPSLEDQNSNSDEIVEPVLDLRQLSSIQVALNDPSNIVRDIDLEYNNDQLLNSITETGSFNQITMANYANNNQLEMLVIDESMQPVNEVTLTYGNDDTVQGVPIVTLSYTQASGIRVDKTLFIDSQNRFNRSLTVETDLTGTTTQVEDFRFQYSQNFNVLRIDEHNSLGALVGYSEFTYNFNNNPFIDMNEIIRLFMFDEFVPYSRFLPATRVDINISTGAAIIERTIDYIYELNNDGFPISRELVIVEGISSFSTFEFFNYRP